MSSKSWRRGTVALIWFGLLAIVGDVIHHGH
jgi:hypothetical protein